LSKPNNRSLCQYANHSGGACGHETSIWRNKVSCSWLKFGKFQPLQSLAEHVMMSPFHKEMFYVSIGAMPEYGVFLLGNHSYIYWWDFFSNKMVVAPEKLEKDNSIIVQYVTNISSFFCKFIIMWRLCILVEAGTLLFHFSKKIQFLVVKIMHVPLHSVMHYKALLKNKCKS
jgi:hypothetical protein